MDQCQRKQHAVPWYWYSWTGMYRLDVALSTRFFTLYFEKSTVFCDYQHFSSISTIPTQSVHEISSSFSRRGAGTQRLDLVSVILIPTQTVDKKGIQITILAHNFFNSHNSSIILYIAMTSVFLEFQRYLNDCQMSYGCRKRYHQQCAISRQNLIIGFWNPQSYY